MTFWNDPMTAFTQRTSLFAGGALALGLFGCEAVPPPTDAFPNVDDRARARLVQSELVVTTDDGTQTVTTDVGYDEEGCVSNLDTTVDGEDLRRVSFDCTDGDIQQAVAEFRGGESIALVYTYDADGRLTHAEGDSLGEGKIVELDFGYETTDIVSSYDANVDIDTVTYELGLDYDYNEDVLVDHVEGSALTEAGFWIFETETEESLARDIVYDDSNLIASIETTRSGEDDSRTTSVAYRYDDVGRLIEAVSDDDVTTTVEYNEDGLVSKVTTLHPAAEYVTTYTYAEGPMSGLVFTPDVPASRFFDLAGAPNGRIEAELTVLSVPTAEDLRIDG